MLIGRTLIDLMEQGLTFIGLARAVNLAGFGAVMTALIFTSTTLAIFLYLTQAMPPMQTRQVQLPTQVTLHQQVQPLLRLLLTPLVHTALVVCRLTEVLLHMETPLQPGEVRIKLQ